MTLTTSPVQTQPRVRDVPPPTRPAFPLPTPNTAIRTVVPATRETAPETEPDEILAHRAAAVALASVEVLCGIRPPQQLRRWLSTPVFDQLLRQAGLIARLTPARGRQLPLAVVRVRTCRIGPGVCESTVIIRHGSRTRFAALRLETHRDRWQATALEVPP